MSVLRRSWIKAYFQKHTVPLVFVALFNFIVLFFVFASRFNSNLPLVVRYRSYDPHAITCYRATANIDWKQFDKLLSENKSDKKIFFLSTSCKGGLDSRESCAVESAARTHPDWQIIVFLLSELHTEYLTSTTFESLKQLGNIQFSKVIFSTRMDSKAVVPIVNSSSGFKNETSLSFDWLRFFILKWHGGVFLDLDMIITKSFEWLPNNWVASQSVSELGAGAMRLSNDSLGRKVVSLCYKSIYSQIHNRQTLNMDREAVITVALQQICFAKNVTFMKSEFCQGFGILESYHFYLMERTQWFYYLRPGALSLLDTVIAYGHKTWSSMSLDTIYGPGTKLALMAQKYCPATYNAYGREFGL